MTQKKGFVGINEFIEQLNRPKRTLKVTHIDIDDVGAIRYKGTYNKSNISGFF
jgi:hypothetical protein